MRTPTIPRLFLVLAFAVVSRADDPAPITPADLDAAARVQGLEFTGPQRDLAAPTVAEQRDSIRRLRAAAIADTDAPALIFQVLAPGIHAAKDNGRFHWEPRPEIRRPADAAELAWMSVADLASLLRSRHVTSEELTRLSLDRLERHGPELRCVVTLTRERALASARRADAEIRAGKWRGPLHGIPYGAKDLLDTRGIPTTWGVSLHTNRIPDRDATVIKRLDDAGAVLVAKLSLGELAMGDVWFGGKTRNPWKPESGSSGSSAGSAAAVAAGLVPFAIGSETLGSIVSPATVCGVTGLRPTFGRVPRSGAMTLCGSLDKLGPLARSAEDCALVLRAIAGPDGEDGSVVAAPFGYDARRDVRKLRVGFLQADLEGDTANRTNHADALAVLRRLGINPRVVALPKIPKEPLSLVLMAEAAASFDTLTRGHDAERLVQQEAGSWPNQFRAARFIPAVEFIQANRVRTQLMRAMDDLFRDLDVLVAPAWNGNILLYSNFSGHPCVAVPNGAKEGGAPAEICFVGGLFGEANALELARAYQSATPWHRQRPPAFTGSR